MNNELLAIDIGSSKITAAICSQNEDNILELEGIGSSISEGFHLGNVISLAKLVDSIKAAVVTASEMAGVDIKEAIVGITGEHIKSYNCQGVYYRTNPSEVISNNDLKQVLETAKASSLYPDREIIHTIPQNYLIDDQSVESPLGMNGKKLTGDFHFVTGSVSVLHNIMRAVNFSELDVSNLIFNGMASSCAVLSTEEEKKIGIIVVDIGEGTIDISLFINGNLWHTGVVMIGGFLITRDLSVRLRVPFKEAERIKKVYGNVLFNKNDPSEIEVEALGSKPKKMVKLALVNEIITLRVIEMFEQIAADVISSKLDDIIPLGIIFTGGTSKIKGLPELASSLLKMPAYIGIPSFVRGQKEIVENPENSSVLGLIKYHLEQEDKLQNIRKQKISEIDNIFSNISIFDSIKNNFSSLKKQFLK